MKISSMLVDPFTTGQVRAFHSVWRQIALDDLGVRQSELEGDLDKALKPYLDKKPTPEILNKISMSLSCAAKAFEKRHEDIRFTSCKIDHTPHSGNINIDIAIERSGVTIKTLTQLHPVLQAELGFNPSLTPKKSRIAGKYSDRIIIDDPTEPVDIEIGLGLELLAYNMNMSRFLGETDAAFRDRLKKDWEYSHGLA